MQSVTPVLTCVTSPGDGTEADLGTVVTRRTRLALAAIRQSCPVVESSNRAVGANTASFKAELTEGADVTSHAIGGRGYLSSQCAIVTMGTEPSLFCVTCIGSHNEN